MNVYTTDKIRNVALLGHAGSGKTSLVEAITYLAGMTSRMGSVANGNTLSDYEKEEVKRGGIMLKKKFLQLIFLKMRTILIIQQMPMKSYL